MDKHWSGYLNAVGGNPVPQTSMPAPYLTSDPTPGTSGFLDLQVKKPDIQARYDAMSGSWAGVKASDAALSNGLFKTESMPIDKTLPQYTSK
jgi:hypothetical protein|uniref:Uncharacterized protein n=1 Tax=viral metagenome TaxID=1070528 RepID=A0A6C0DTQ9_9ZZZZ